MLRLKFPSLVNEIEQVIIPICQIEDQMIWEHSDNGEMAFKDAFKFLHKPNQNLSWGKLIWSPFIPPSKSFILWRLLHNKMPTDDQLKNRGCMMAYVCSLCCNEEETSMHLFLNCSFAKDIWSRISMILNCQIDTSSYQSILSILKRNWSFQLKDIVLSSLISVICAIWYLSNQVRYKNKHASVSQAISLITSSIFLSGRMSSGCMQSSIDEFTIPQSFSVEGHPTKAPKYIQVNWFPPKCGWIKCNSDGAAHGSPGHAPCGDLFRDSSGAILGCFSSYIGIGTAFDAELLGAVLAVEIVFNRG